MRIPARTIGSCTICRAISWQSITICSIADASCAAIACTAEMEIRCCSAMMCRAKSSFDRK